MVCTEECLRSALTSANGIQEGRNVLGSPRRHDISTDFADKWNVVCSAPSNKSLLPYLLIPIRILIVFLVAHTSSGLILDQNVMNQMMRLKEMTLHFLPSNNLWKLDLMASSAES